MKTLLTYYLISTGACYVANRVAISAYFNKLNRELEERGYESIKGSKISTSEKIVNFVKAIPAYTIPIVRWVIPFVFIKFGDNIVEKTISAGMEKNAFKKKEENMTNEERIAAIESKKAELESLKETLANNGTYNFDADSYPSDGYVGEEETKTL